MVTTPVLGLTFLSHPKHLLFHGWERPPLDRRTSMNQPQVLYTSGASFKSGPLSAGLHLYQRIGELRDRHMSMTLSFETFSTMEPLSSRGRSRPILVFTKRELQGKHSWLSALRFFCGTFFDSRSLLTNLGLNRRGATRQADEFDTQSQVLAACGETLNPHEPC